MVDVTGIEPATPCLQRLFARRINKLYATSPFATESYKFFIRENLNEPTRTRVTLGRARWWAQKWAQSVEVPGRGLALGLPAFFLYFFLFEQGRKGCPDPIWYWDPSYRI